MRRIFKKVLAGATSVALVASLVVGLNVAQPTEVKAADSLLQPWSVYHSPKMMTSIGEWGIPEWQNGNKGVVTSFKAGDEVITAPTLNETNAEQTLSTTQVATGFEVNILTTGWDKDWGQDRINPWSVTVDMKQITVIPGHMYTITFKAKASKQKYAYLTGGVTYSDGATGSIFEGNMDVQKFRVMDTTEKSYTLDFTNWVSAEKFDFGFMLGAFGSENDFDGTSLKSQGYTVSEGSWNGTVTVTDFTITDKGLNPDYVEVTTPETTTKKPIVPTTQRPTIAPTTRKPVVSKPAKATIKSAKNVKGKKIKVTWKKIATATKYQVKVGTKKATTTKLSYTIKKLKKNKKYKVQVRAYNSAGYGQWSKAKTVKVKK